MAIASVGTLGTGTSSTSNSSWTMTTATNTLAAGDHGILTIISDNISTVDGNTNDHLTASCTSGVWTKLGEYTNTVGGAAGDGVCTSVWRCLATGTIGTGVTVTMTTSANVTQKCCSFWKFTVANGNVLQLDEGITNPVNNGTDASNGYGSVSFSGLASASRLYYRGLGKESNTTTAITVSASFSAITATRSTTGSGAVCFRGEFRINTSTGETSNPTLAIAADTAAVFVALSEGPLRIVPTDSLNVKMATDEGASLLVSADVQEATTRVSATDAPLATALVSAQESNLAVTQAEQSNPFATVTERESNRLVVTESMTGVGTGSAADTAMVTVSDAPTILASLAVAESAGLTAIDNRDIIALASAVDAVRVAITEANAVVASLAPTDALALIAAETSVILTLLAASETWLVRLSEVGESAVAGGSVTDVYSVESVRGVVAELTSLLAIVSAADGEWR